VSALAWPQALRQGMEWRVAPLGVAPSVAAEVGDAVAAELGLAVTAAVGVGVAGAAPPHATTNTATNANGKARPMPNPRINLLPLSVPG
jgi:hypothetical protein